MTDKVFIVDECVYSVFFRIVVLSVGRSQNHKRLLRLSDSSCKVNYVLARSRRTCFDLTVATARQISRVFSSNDLPQVGSIPQACSTLMLRIFQAVRQKPLSRFDPVDSFIEADAAVLVLSLTDMSLESGSYIVCDTTISLDCRSSVSFRRPALRG